MIKVCGMREAENIRAVEDLGIDMMGFILYHKSARYVAEPPKYMPTKCKKVGVFVGADSKEILRQVERFGLDYVQLHSEETPELCRELKGRNIGVIKAISVAVAEDIKAADRYDGCCDYFVFDTKCEGYGGSGEVFDWGVLAAYDGATPFLLSGGLGDDCVDGLRHFDHPQMAGYDLNSRFESRPALKDIDRIKRFLNEIKR